MIDSRLVDHGERVGYMLYMMLDDRDLRQRLDALLLGVFHDVGAYKTEEIDQMVRFETDDILQHSVYGYLFLREMTPLSHVADAILYHHLRYDNSDGVQSPNLKLGMLIHLADRVDLLAHAMSKQQCLDYIKNQSGVLFSPEAVELFIAKDEQYGLIEAITCTKYYEEVLKICDNLTMDKQTIDAYFTMMVNSIVFRSPFTLTHSITSQTFSMGLARLCGFDEIMLEKVYYGSMLHDIGKIATPLSILESTGKLTPEQWTVMKRHVVNSREILKGSVSEEVLRIATRHHEKLDGSGYPDGLKADQLTTAERIVALADILSALSGTRSYKNAFEKERTLSIIAEDVKRGKLDADLCKIAAENYDELHETAKQKADELVALYDSMKTEYDSLLQSLNAKH